MPPHPPTHLLLLAGLVFLGGTNSFAQSPAVSPDDDLVGLWGSDTSLGPSMRGLAEVIGGADGSWRGRIAGIDVPANPLAAGLQFILPASQGRLYVPYPQPGRSLHGYWSQPNGNDNRGAFATPVPFRIIWSPGPVLQGTITPREDRVALYLIIQRDDSGGLRGSFHDAETGWNRGLPWFRVVRNGQAIEFRDPSTGAVKFARPYNSARRTITMDSAGPVLLSPRAPDQAPGYYPRPPSEAPYSYRKPAQADDGWQTTAASKVGLNDSLLVALVRRIATTDPAATDVPRIHSLLVARHGKLVLEEYFYGFTADRPHDLRSAGKSFTGLMAGIAIDQGKLKIGTPVYGVLDPTGTTADPRKGRITLANLLTHTSGLACDDEDSGSPGNEDRMQQQREQLDWYRYTLDLPMAHEPGSTYAYCSATMNLAGGVIAKATGSPLLEFFDANVAAPLGITGWQMNLMPNGDAYAAGSIYMRPRDLLKLGQLYLDGGKWNGWRVVSKQWFEQSTTRKADATDGSADGYAFHLHSLTAGGKSWREYDASGNGGQLVIVLPELDLVVLFTAGNYDRARIWRKFRDELVPEYVIGAVRR